MQTIKDVYFKDNALITFEDDLNKARILKQYSPQINLIDNQTFIGIEMEVERIYRTSGFLQINEGTFLWRNTEDNSLRNDGREFVSLPIRGDNIPFALEVINAHFKKDKTCLQHEFSDRTSVHIHMNARDLSIEQVMTFTLAYLLVEPLLYKFVGGDRAKNIFCVPITESNLSYVVGRMMTSFENGKLKDCLAHSLNWQKYTGLNLLPLSVYGTIEFRHMTGTSDEQTLLTWINLILSLKKYALSVSYSTLKDLILSLNTTSEYVQTLRNIFGEYADILQTDNLQGGMERTSIFVKDALISEKSYAKFAKEFSQFSCNNANDIKFFRHAERQGFIKIISNEDRIKRIVEQRKPYIDEIDRMRKVNTDLQIALADTTLSSYLRTKYKKAFTSNEETIKIYILEIEKFDKQIATLKGEWTTDLSGIDLNEVLLDRPRPRRVILDEDF
jgi:hypothetical protein